MNRQSILPLLVFSAFAAVTTAAQGAPVIFFAEDTTTAQSVVGTNSEAKRNQFLGNLVGVGNEDFEGIAVGTLSPVALSFPGSSGAITATLTGAGCLDDSASSGCPATNPGRWPTSGDRFWEDDSGGAFEIAFSDPISAFGFYGTDIGDFDNQLIITLTDLLDDETVINVPHSTGLGNEDNALLFWGFFDTATTYTKIGFSNAGTGGDVFAFDDMVIGDREQVRPVPEPGSLALLGVALLGFRSLRRRLTQ